MKHGRWQPYHPDGRSKGALPQFIRQFICAQGGSCKREEVLTAINSHPILSKRLEQYRGGMCRALYNMKVGGFVQLHGDRVIATPKTRPKRGPLP